MGLGRPQGSFISAVERQLWDGLVGLALVLGATFVRAALDPLFPNLTPFGLYYPVVLAAALLGRGMAAIFALVASVVLGWGLFMRGAGPPLDTPSALANLAIFTISAALVGAVGVGLTRLQVRRNVHLERLAERELRYRTLFESVSDGFCLVRALRDDAGKLLDYVILEANPALLRIMATDASIIGRRQSEVLRRPPPTWLEACEAALKGRPITFEYHSPEAGQWFEIHLSRVGEDQLAQFIVDITDRKVAESRQSELFDELNHRVKNNLAMVSATLGMQARAAQDPKLREALNKAIDRIHTIADVHAALYRSSSKDRVDFAAYLHDLCRRLSGSLLTDERIRIDVMAEPAALPLEKAVALGVVVNELVTNAAKHAFPSPNCGTIRVDLRRESGGLALSVGDSGKGLPADAAPGAGLGMRLIRSLVQQLDGQLEVRGDAGACFTIHLREPGILPLTEAAQHRLL